MLVVAVSTGLPMLHTVLLSNEKLLLLRGEVAPPQLVLTNPSENFFSAFKRERYGGEINLRVFLEDGITIVAVNKGVTPDDQRRNQLAFLVLFVELCLFGCQLRILGFQLFRAGQLGEVVCLEIGCCRPVRCQLCTVLFFKGCGAIFLVFL